MIAAMINSQRMDYSHGDAKFYKTLEKLAKTWLYLFKSLTPVKKLSFLILL